MWQEESDHPTKIITGNFTVSYSLFVTLNGDIYIDDGLKDGRIQKWSSETNIFVTVMNVNSSCYGLFVDINDTLYCSMFHRHQVVKRSLNDSVMSSNRVAAGTGAYGSASNQLRGPRGIFVDVNLDLYVADCINNRVQLFQSGESSGITLVGSESLNPTIILEWPSEITLDAEKYLFIVDSNNHRIVGSSMNGFRCLVGCYGRGSKSNQLHNPSVLSFDRSGNMFITDEYNSRIQKFLLTKDSFALSFNQPKLCLTAAWNPNGITFADEAIVGKHPPAIFVNTNNTIHVINQQNSTIVMWQEESDHPTKIITGNFTVLYSLFVTLNGDIYIGDGLKDGRIQKWSSETNIFVTVMNVNSSCYGLFVDINDALYCSMSAHHQVVKRSLNDSVMSSNRVAAGTGAYGSALNQLYDPRGIFVDVNLDLYVTDCRNNRVQLFQSGESSGITVVGSESLNPTIILNCPSAMILDAQKYLFIVDQNNHRIVGLGLNGFQCLVGCYGRGSKSNQLSSPSSLSFDRAGNMFVTNADNFRIQRFIYLKKSCDNLLKTDDDSGFDTQFKLDIHLDVDIMYVLVVTTYESKETGEFSIFIFGKNKVILQRLSAPVNIQLRYSSKLTDDSPTYYRDCQVPQCHYETSQIYVNTTGLYVLWSENNINAYGYIYKNDFNPLKPSENLLLSHDDPTESSCVIGDQCNFYIKGIGLTLDDILRDELKSKTVLNNQSFLIKLSAALTIIIDSRLVGCGMYLLASSITSLLTITMFIIKFWFVVLTHINVSTSLSVLRGGCVSIEPILKLFLYLDGWFNACVAVERAVLIFKGVKFDKKKSKSIARRTILILPFCIFGTLIHELAFRRLFVYETVPDTRFDVKISKVKNLEW
ncbi:unnamed protein product [Adineta steineri]|uniref:NHL repeat containing protein-like protein n=1 Tax=Adineta steineri TaxID=433720 RepID=A0A819QBH0_9BILA|nr:unnamed protein product [Adineta steineri]